MKRKIKNLINAMCYELRATRNKGMTYVELIVVLSIFSIMSAIAMFNYRDFQAKIDIKSLATDIALQVVQAQKDSLNGKLPVSGALFDIAPAYGIQFSLSPNDVLVPFVDLTNDGFGGAGEDLDVINITKNNKISVLKIVDANGCLPGPSNLYISFQRPDSRAIVSDGFNSCVSFKEAIIRISSPNDVATANIYVYPSGRIEIKND